jgi:peptidyl-prolyl cis-trans isomerase C
MWQRTLVLITVMAVGSLSACKPEKPASQDNVRKARTKAASHDRKKQDDNQASLTTATERENPRRKVLEKSEKDLVVARVGKVMLTLGDLESEMKRHPVHARSRHDTFEGKVAILNNMIQRELFAREARKRGYDTHPDVVFAMKNAMISHLLRTDLKSLVKDGDITDDDIRRYYENNQSKFVKLEQVGVSHIQFSDKKKAAKILADLTGALKQDKDGTKARVIFADFARRFSANRRTGSNNGAMGYFTKGGYVDGEREDRLTLSQELIGAAFRLKKRNQISPLVKDALGYHIVQLTGRRPAVNRSLAAARRQIKNTLLRLKADKARTEYVKKLRDRAKPIVYEERLKLLDPAARNAPKGSR